MKHKYRKTGTVLFTVCLVMSMFAGSAFAAKMVFADSVGHWAEESINQLEEEGIISGYPDGLVHPDEIITRGEFAALVARTMEFEKSNDQQVSIIFADIVGNWAEKDIQSLIVSGIIRKDDYHSTKYFPDEPITRMEMIRMLVRAMEIGNHGSDCTSNTGFTDTANLSEEDREYICMGKQYYIISGYPDGTVRPENKATRGEAFEMFVKQEQAKEKIEKENQQKIVTPEVKPADKPANGSSSSGGDSSSHVPSPNFSFTLPKTAYIGEEVKVVPTSSYVKGVTWKVTKNDLPMELSAVFDGELKADGGAVSFKDTGNYILSAIAVNSRGKEVVCEQIVGVYPIVSAVFSLPETAHTDTAVAVDLDTQNLGANPVLWTLKREGKEVALKYYLLGEIGVEGDSVLFENKGIYELTASITDPLGKVVTLSDTITIYPVAEIKMELPALTHTDKTIQLKTETKEMDGMDITWVLARNGEVVKLADFIEGELINGESTLHFKGKGVYSLTASATDKT